MASEAFLRRNPRYREAGWKSREPREKRPEPGSNLDTFHFQNQGYSRDEAEQMASEAQASGMRTGFGGKGIEPDRMLTPRDRARMGFDKSASKSTSAAPSSDQISWAKKFRENQTRPPLRSAAGPEKPLNFSRSALVEGAKGSGDFAKIREGFNRQSGQTRTGMRMNDLGVATPISKTKVGSDGLTPYAREKFGAAAEDKAAQRDFATGKTTTTSGTTGLSSGINNPDADEMTPDTGGGRPTQASNFRREISSKYGTGSNVTRTPGQAGGTMIDPATGKTVPMKSYLAEQSAVQDTKFGANAAKQGDEYFNPAKIRQSVQRQRGRMV